MDRYFVHRITFINLTDQMQKKGRVKNNCLILRLSFGKAKANQHFDNEIEFNDYVNGDGLTFSQRKSEQTSPFQRKISQKMREDSQNSSTQIAQVVAHLYKTPGCKLYYGFTRQHAETIQRIIAADLSTHREASVFSKAFESGSIPTNDELDTYLMSVYLNGCKNDVPGLLPEMNKYPPINPDTIIAPPDIDEWKKGNESNIFLDNNHTSSMLNLSNQRNRPTIVGLVFKCYKEDKNEFSVLIRGDLTMNSTMLDVMDGSNVMGDLGIADIESSKFLVKKQSGSYLTMKYGQFYNMTVDELLRISNIHQDYVIEIKA